MYLAQWPSIRARVAIVRPRLLALRPCHRLIMHSTTHRLAAISLVILTGHPGWRATRQDCARHLVVSRRDRSHAAGGGVADRAAGSFCGHRGAAHRTGDRPHGGCSCHRLWLVAARGGRPGARGSRVAGRDLRRPALRSNGLSGRLHFRCPRSSTRSRRPRWKGPVLAIWSGFVPLGYATADLLAAVLVPLGGVAGLPGGADAALCPAVDGQQAHAAGRSPGCRSGGDPGKGALHSPCLSF